MLGHVPTQLLAAAKERVPINTNKAVYRQTLLNHSQLVDGDIALTAIEPAPTSFAFKQGLLVATLIFTTLPILTLFSDRKKWWLATLLLAIVTPLALLGFWYSDGVLGISDWDYYFSYHENVRRTVLEFHQLPQWNPWTCGGTAALGDPEFPLFTPTFLLELIFGIPVGFRLAIWLSVGTTAIGMLWLGKRLKLSVYGSLLAIM